MAFLNRQEREKLLNELTTLTFNKAKWKLRRLDPKGSMAFFRNMQTSGKFHTRFNLEGLGTRVTLVETQTQAPSKTPGFNKSQFELVEVIVEPTPENRL